ncbi:hypothetical protein CNR22_00180 [Sphingobacteriaceae bacterium]|nr:hypothetical protein CNR22_00180 [Sphingobacteriaceae bacterium]
MLTGVMSAQNLIQNSSFSKVNNRQDSSRVHRLLPGALSEVEKWYLPQYIHYERNKRGPIDIYGYCRYYSSRDIKYIPKDKIRHYDNVSTNSEQLFENNKGFVALHIDRNSPPSIIQQRFDHPLEKGRYCLKIKYKYLFYKSSYNRPPSLDIVFSDSDLEEFYNYERFILPAKIVSVSLKDSMNNSDENTPWQQRCFNIELKGDEKYISVGSLRLKDKYPWGNFFIDDIELEPMQDENKCACEVINKDLSKRYLKNFTADSIYVSDTLSMFSPSNNFGHNMLSPDAKNYLKNLISFLQRNPEYKIQFIEYDRFQLSNTRPSRYQPLTYYLQFFGISEERITAVCMPCIGLNRIDCGPTAEYTRIGIKFHK